jgi:murein DD-endopeptidase MepM/ murein hydrolase activator NlpD
VDVPVAPVPDVAPEPEIAVPPQPLSEPPARASARFSWPLRGKLLAGFGSAGKGLHNDGINIAAPMGSQVRAADNGVVAYAGNELKGFGNLLLIKHADGFTTAYAHNDKLLVARGDEVKQGQVIAAVGRTGNVDSPQLHFEVRRGTQALDPLEYLSK